METIIKKELDKIFVRFVVRLGNLVKNHKSYTEENSGVSQDKINAAYENYILDFYQLGQLLEPSKYDEAIRVTKIFFEQDNLLSVPLNIKFTKISQNEMEIYLKKIGEILGDSIKKRDIKTFPEYIHNIIKLKSNLQSVQEFGLQQEPDKFELAKTSFLDQLVTFKAHVSIHYYNKLISAIQTISLYDFKDEEFSNMLITQYNGFIRCLFDSERESYRNKKNIYEVNNYRPNVRRRGSSINAKFCPACQEAPCECSDPF